MPLQLAAHQVSYHPAKFVSHRHSSSGETMVFACHMALQDHVIKALNDFAVRSPSRYVTIPPNLVAIVTVTVEIPKFHFVT